MKASLQGKLEKLADRFEELSGLLSDPEIIGNQKKFRDLSREYSEIDPVVKCYQNYLKVAANLDAARAMQDDSDPEMREMGQEEAREATTRIPAMAPMCFWKCAPAPAVMRRRFLPVICSACTANMPSRMAGKSSW